MSVTERKEGAGTSLLPYWLCPSAKAIMLRAQPCRRPRDFRAGLSGVPWVTPWGTTHSLAGGKGEVSELCSPALLIALVIRLLSEVEQGRARWGVRDAPEVYKPQGRFAPGSAFQILSNRTALAPAPLQGPVPQARDSPVWCTDTAKQHRAEPRESTLQPQTAGESHRRAGERKRPC